MCTWPLLQYADFIHKDFMPGIEKQLELAYLLYMVRFSMKAYGKTASCFFAMH